MRKLLQLMSYSGVCQQNKLTGKVKIEMVASTTNSLDEEISESNSVALGECNTQTTY